MSDEANVWNEGDADWGKPDAQWSDRDGAGPAEDEWTEAPRKGALVTTAGVLNLIFGFACGCLGGGYLVLAFMLPAVMSQAVATASAAQAAQRSQLVSRIDAANSALAAATDDPEASPTKAELQAELSSLQTKLARLDANDPKAILQKVVDIVSGPAITGSLFGYATIALLWNLGLIITGFGLFGRHGWARSGLLGLAGMKLLLEIGFAVWVMTTFSDAMGAVFDVIPKSGPGAPTPAELQQIKQSMQLQGVLQGVVGSIFGSIYPAVLLVFFMTRGVRQEFLDWAQWRRSGGRG